MMMGGFPSDDNDGQKLKIIEHYLLLPYTELRGFPSYKIKFLSSSFTRKELWTPFRQLIIIRPSRIQK